MLASLLLSVFTILTAHGLNNFLGLLTALRSQFSLRIWSGPTRLMAVRHAWWLFGAIWRLVAMFRSKIHIVIGLVFFCDSWRVWQLARMSETLSCRRLRAPIADKLFVRMFFLCILCGTLASGVKSLQPESTKNTESRGSTEVNDAPKTSARFYTRPNVLSRPRYVGKLWVSRHPESESRTMLKPSLSRSPGSRAPLRRGGPAHRNDVSSAALLRFLRVRDVNSSTYHNVEDAPHEFDRCASTRRRIG